jgi:hypothetical protein
MGLWGCMIRRLVFCGGILEGVDCWVVSGLVLGGFCLFGVCGWVLPGCAEGPDLRRGPGAWVCLRELLPWDSISVLASLRADNPYTRV